MSAVCLLDTSVLVEILDVPGKSQHCTATRAALAGRIKEGQTLFLPMTTVLETGDQNAARRVYIWSLDQHLQAYDRAAVV